MDVPATAVDVLDLLKGGQSKMLKTEFEFGDMVWGKIKSHPWWPAQIFHEDLAASAVDSAKREGSFLVSFYGDDTYGWLGRKDLIPFDPNCKQKSSQSNTQAFLVAIDIAVHEMKKRVALGLTCHCQSPNNFRRTEVPGVFEVDVIGYPQPGIYSTTQIKKARDGFQPHETILFMKKLALCPRDNLQGFPWMKNAEKVLAYRRAVFEKIDFPYFEAFGVQPMNYKDLDDLCNKEKSIQAPLGGMEVIEAPDETQSLMEPTDSIAPKEDYNTVQRGNLNISRERTTGRGDRYKAKHKRSVTKPERGWKQDAVGSHAENSKASRADRKGKAAITRKKSEITNADIGMIDCEVEQNYLLPASFPTTQLSAHPAGFCNLIASGEPEAADLNHKQKTEFSIVRTLDRSDLTETFQSQGTQSIELYDVPIICGMNKSIDVKSPDKGLVMNRKIGKKKKIIIRPRQNLPPSDSCVEPQIKMKRKEDPLSYDGENKRKCLKSASFSDCGRQPSAKVSGICTTRSEVYKGHHSFHSKNFASGFQSNFYEEVSGLTPSSNPVPKRFKPDDKKGSRIGSQVSTQKRKENFMKEMKSAVGSKKAGEQMPLELFRRDNIGIQATSSMTSGKLSCKEPNPLSGDVEPALLIIRFPSQAMLPSVSELKAKFARFGPLHESFVRVFWKTSKCQVVFKCKSSAQAAYDYAGRSKKLFSNSKVQYSLRDFEISVQTSSKPGESRKQISEGPKALPLTSCSKNVLLSFPSNCISGNVDIRQFVNAVNMKYRLLQADRNYHQRDTNDTDMIDISDQFITLLLRCHDILANIVPRK